MDGVDERFRKIISDNIESFEKYINFLRDETRIHIKWSYTPDFPIFKPTSQEYRRYSYFEKMTERAIREKLVNPIIKQLFVLHGISCEWPDFQNTFCGSFPNAEFEKMVAFEFIVEKDNLRIGYRYASPSGYDNGMIPLIVYKKIHHVVVIDWSDEYAKESACCIDYSNMFPNVNISSVTIRSFFDEFFSEKEYRYFIKELYKVVQRANEKVGFKTIPSLSLQWLSDFTFKYVEECKTNHFSQYSYEPIKSSATAIELLSQEDVELIDGNFTKNELFRAFVGKKDFSRSFITSEYLYKAVFDNPKDAAFDYTPIVSGYLKSIEQLIYEIIKFQTSLVKREDDIWIKSVYIEKGYRRIKRNGDILSKDEAKEKFGDETRGTVHIRFLPKYIDYFDTTLQPLINVLSDNPQSMLLSTCGKSISLKILSTYKEECRNGYLHKHNIYDFDLVSKIRHDTILLFYLLIGGCRLPDETKETHELLGIIDNSYDRLYQMLVKLPANCYFSFGGEEPFKVIRLPNQSTPEYDQFGGLSLSKIRYVKVSSFDVDSNYDKFIKSFSDNDFITVSVENMPSRVWFAISELEKKRSVLVKIWHRLSYGLPSLTLITVFDIA